MLNSQENTEDIKNTSKTNVTQVIESDDDNDSNKSTEIHLKQNDKETLLDDKNKTNTTENNTSKFNTNSSIFKFLSFFISILIIYYLHSIVKIKLMNHFRRSWYLPKHQLSFFIDHPIDDIKFKIPVYYSSDFNFPDFNEAVNIQLQGRLKAQDSVVLGYEFDFRKGDYDKFTNGDYANDTFSENAMFLKLILSTDNAIKVDGIYSYAELYFTLAAINTNDLPFFITQLLVDYCFNEELKFYQINNYFKVEYPTRNRKTLAHYNYYKYNIWNKKISLSFAMLGNSKKWNIDDAFNNYLNKDLIEPLSGIYNFTYLEWNDILPDDYSIDFDDENEHFPIELIDIPELPQLYDLTKDIKKNPQFYLTYYPIDLAREDILLNKTLNNGTTNLITQDENSFHSISDWGIVYFAHGETASDDDDDDTQEESESVKSENDEENTPVSEIDMKDSMWAFMEGILNHLDIPNSNMSPKLRVMMFKRIMIIHNLVRFSNFLFRIDCWLDDNDYLITNKLIDSVRLGLQLRKKVLEFCSISEFDEALKITREMLELVGTQIDFLEIGNDVISNLNFIELDSEYNAEYN